MSGGALTGEALATLLRSGDAVLLMYHPGCNEEKPVAWSAYPAGFPPYDFVCPICHTAGLRGKGRVEDDQLRYEFAPSARAAGVAPASPTAPTPKPTPKPKAGDAVVLAADWYGSNVMGMRGVIDSSPYGHGEGELQVVLRASAYRQHGEADDYVSCSGGPCPCVPIGELIYVGPTEQRFWRFKGGQVRAHNGEDYTLTVNLWSWVPPRHDRQPLVLD